MFQKLYQLLLAPVARAEDDRRRESILDILLLASMCLALAAWVVSIINLVIESSNYSGSSPLLLLIITIVFGILLATSRVGFYRQAAYCFIAIFLVAATYPLIIWGIQLPEAVLVYSLVIVMAGVLLSSRMAFVISGLIGAVLLLIVELNYRGVVQADTSWSKYGGNYSDAIVYVVTFLIISIVAWLSNREIEASLRRARQSEADLTDERNLLEVKVHERTRDLQLQHIEKVSQLERFAEFGQLNSTLMHDLSNPLTSVSIELEQIAGSEHAALVSEARKGILSMERYVQAARRQLRKESEIKLFNAAEEIELVTDFLESKARDGGVKLRTLFGDDLLLFGDSSKFNQIMANLIANGIDAYDTLPHKPNKEVIIAAKVVGKSVRVKVRDRAVGIKPTDIKRIFEAFYTTKNIERGSGLGLYITKQSVEQDFKCTITIDCPKDGGTCFTVSLPKA